VERLVNAVDPINLARRSALHPALEAVALVDAETCAAAGGMSVSWWHIEVRAGRAPAPALRGNRCTRWRLTEVAEFWAALAERAAGEAADAIVEKAKSASRAASAKRRSSVKGDQREGHGDVQ